MGYDDRCPKWATKAKICKSDGHETVDRAIEKTMLGEQCRQDLQPSIPGGPTPV